MPAAPPLDSVVLVPEQMPTLPPAREFLTSAGFGGALGLAALLLAAVILIALWRASKRGRAELDLQESHNRQVREAEQHNTAVDRCWQRLVWVVETAGIEPAASQGATVGLGPELTLELLRGLLRDAESLGDATLTGAVTVYLSQFSQVLTQQGSVTSEPAVRSDSAEPAAAHAPSGQEETAQSSGSAADSGDTPRPRPAKAVAAGQGRRRRQ